MNAPAHDGAGNDADAPQERGSHRALTRRQALETGAGAAMAAAFASPLNAGMRVETSSLDESRRRVSFDEDWLFHRGDAAGAEGPAFDDRDWRKLDLPHDWRIEDLPHATSNDGGATADPSLFAFNGDTPGKTPPPAIGPFDRDADPKPDVDIEIPQIGRIVMPGGRSQGYTVAGMGWYRKRFRLPASDDAGATDRRVEICFDGVYENADIWLNGVHLGFHPYGYTSFAFDLTPHLKTGGENVLAVRVDNRGKSSRWYAGSGIYRHTWLTVTGGVFIPRLGVHVTTPTVDPRRSVVQVAVQVASRSGAASASVRLTLVGPDGRDMAVTTTQAQRATPDATVTHSAQLVVPDAALWSPEKPSLYRVRAEILVSGKVVDATTTPFGIRSVLFNGQGFFLNGKPYRIRGGNLHHDHGPLGAVAIDRAEERTVEIMKAAGFNAVRAAHNPASPAFLDACDRLGVFVYEEFSDMWDIPKQADDYHKYFPEWWQRDLSEMVLRDRNHPSIILWSIGNEISADPKRYGPRMAALVRSLDRTRPLAQGGMNVGPKDADAWSYVDVGDYHGTPPAADRAAHPDKAFLQSENTSPQIYDDWQAAETGKGYVGDWIWPGWDYIGESALGAPVLAGSPEEAARAALGPALGKIPYPWFTSIGDIDLIGQRRPQNKYRAVVTGSSRLEMLVGRPTPPGKEQYNVGYSFYDELESWTWDVPQGQPMTVRVYTSGDSVTLQLNGRTVATNAVSGTDKRIATFKVPYAPGELVAIASLGGKEIARRALETVGIPAALRLKPDVPSLTTGRGDLAHVLVEVVDDKGRVVPDAVVQVAFAASGAGELVGVANANPHNVDSFRRPRRWTWHGQALAILRPAKTPGAVTLVASATGLRSAKVALAVAPAP